MLHSLPRNMSRAVVSRGNNTQSPNELIGDRGETKLIKYKVDKLCRHPKVNSESIFRDQSRIKIIFAKERNYW